MMKRPSIQTQFIKIGMILMLLIGFLNLGVIVHGEETPEIAKKEETITKDSSSANIGFTVIPVFSDSQIDESKGFYYIRTLPGETQELKLKIKSTRKEPEKASIYVKNGYTTENGAIDYDNKKHIRDKTLVNSVEELTTVNKKEVTVENYETKEVVIKVSSPRDSFKGIKCGAICVMKSEDKKENKGLSSSYGYRVGLLITENDEVYDDGKSLNFLNVSPKVYRGKRVIQARLQNPEPKILDNLTVETKLRKKGSNEVLRKRSTSDMRMAPNSQFDFSTNWGVDPIKPGTYILSVKATSNEKTWSWSKEFTIGDSKAKKINEEASFTLTYPKWVPIVVILLGILTILTIGCLYLRRKKWAEEE